MCVLQTSTPVRNGGTPLGSRRECTSLLFKIVGLYFAHTHMSTHTEAIWENIHQNVTVSYLSMLGFHVIIFFSFFIVSNISLTNIYT